MAVYLSIMGLVVTASNEATLCRDDSWLVDSCFADTGVIARMLDAVFHYVVYFCGETMLLLEAACHYPPGRGVTAPFGL